MNSSNRSFITIRRALVAATVALTVGNVAVLAQTSGSQDSSSMSNSNNSTNDTNYSSANSANASQNQNSSDMSSNNNGAMSNNESANSSSNDKLSWSERRFVEKAAKGGKEEVALGQLAQEQASNPDVKSFGQTLVQDHTMANSQLEQLAQQKNVKMDQKDDGKDHFYKSLSKKSGTDFDKEFVDHEVKDHQKDIKEFQKMAQDAKDPDLKNFAAQILPKLQEHLATAQRLQQSIEATGRPSGFNSSSSSSTSENSTTSSAGATSESSSLSGTNSATSSAGTNAGTSATSTASTQ